MEIEDLAPLVMTLDPLRNMRRRAVLHTGESPSGGGPPTSGLALWFKGDAGTFQDTLGGTPAVADNDPVALWQDQSGNGRHATQSTGTQRPLLKTAFMDGVAGLNAQDSLFHGLNLASQFDLTGDFTVYCVGKRAAGKKFVALGSKTSWSVVTVFEDNNVYVADDSNTTSSALAYTGGTGAIMCRWTRTGTAQPKFKGGGQANATMTGASPAQTVAISSVLARLGLGAISSADGVTEILVYTTNDSVTQGQAETYLLGKYPSATF